MVRKTLGGIHAQGVAVSSCVAVVAALTRPELLAMAIASLPRLADLVFLGCPRGTSGLPHLVRGGPLLVARLVRGISI